MTGYGRRWDRLRAHMVMLATLSAQPTYCGRCGLVIPDVRDADLGHVVDRVIADPTQPVEVRWEHRHCNRAAGMATAREQTRRPRYTSTAWESNEL